eukprot:3054201-Pyramimonas_sp.AAC.1
MALEFGVTPAIPVAVAYHTLYGWDKYSVSTVAANIVSPALFHACTTRTFKLSNCCCVRQA